MNYKAVLITSVLCSSLMLSGCGGSDGEATTAISGSVFAAAVDGASLAVTDGNGNAVAGPVMTSAGSYTVNIPNSLLASDLVFESTGGSFTDEASGDAATAGAVSAYVAGGTLAAGSEVHATPATTIIRHMIMQHEMTMTQAQEAFANAFGYTPDISIAPTNATDPAADAEEAQKLAGLQAAVFSQLAFDLGLTPEQQFDLCIAFAEDLSDGELDGESVSGAVNAGSMTLPEDIHARLVRAMINFRNSGHDNTGLNSAQLGSIPLAKVVLTDTYRVEYVPGMMEAMAGKTTFKLNVTDRDSGAAVPGLSVTMMPMMHMGSGHNHSTPVGNITDQGNGNYMVTIYYVMPSVMGGEVMGFWDLEFMVNGEEAHFNPSVMMAMGDTLQTRLKGRMPDTIMSMTGGMEGRTYFIFHDGLSGTSGNYTFNLFVAAKNTMMSFPAIDVGTTLSTGDVTSVGVEVSTDGASFDPATNNGSGSYTMTGLDISNTVYVRLTVGIDAAEQQKTTDGMAPDGGVDPVTTNEFATFTVTP